MSRNRAFAFLLTVLASVAMALGLTAFTATAASATPGHPVQPHGHYAPPPPMLMVNKGVVKKGVVVRATGRTFGNRQKVLITVTFRAKGSNRTRVVKTAVVRTDKKGNFTFNYKTRSAGIVTIVATAKKTHDGAAASVYVIDKKKGGWWNFRRASYTAGATTGVTDTSAVARTSSSTPSDITWIALASLGVLALAGSTMITRRVALRRRKA